ncbi:hypothetical protein [Halodesulfovibrio marinisediminis]|uniref:SH3 domain-containing protein n=1 Tax=Halodesulfovibrio marinisediminis DSM 17456 TaxID=1121457 RepID=A0A1N6IUF9_9BACT|nr:hypothetical protein [Halodesulfovibrio marinisediminis]SIO35595.1 hypothetical protein SAMN02745161_2942 [Halodesulfovibrio marinisediminis DSM 17456]
MNTLKKVFLVLVMACAFVTFVMHFDAYASPYHKAFVTKRVSKVYPDLRTLERYVDVAAHRPHKINKFMRKNHVVEISKGTRVVRVGSVLLQGCDAVIYKVRIPSRGQYGYIFSRNLRKAKKYSPCVVEHRGKYKEKCVHKVKHKVKHKEKHKVKYVEKHVETYVEKYVPEYDESHTIKFKAIIETPALVINLL